MAKYYYERKSSFVKGIEKGTMKGIGKRIIPAVWAFFSDYYLHLG